MGFSPPVPQDDSDWEIRVAVLLSLLLQVLLIFVGPVRKRSSASFPRFLVWSCYLLADWVADLALGLMLNNMGNIGGSSSSSSTVQLQHVSGGLKRGPSGGTAVTNNGNPIIFAFWTPFLLLHLGGPDTITAYSREDNELWLRHLIGLLFELFSACVIFFCSLKTNPMVPATVLMFLVGVVKYGERTYSLYSGSVNGFRAKILIPEPGPDYAQIMNEYDAIEKAGFNVKIIMDEARKALDGGEQVPGVQNERNLSLEAQAYTFFLMFRRLFVNLILSYKERTISQAYFLDNDVVKMSPAKAFEVIEVELNFIYDMVYTKAPVAHTEAGCVLRFLSSACIVSSLLIFFFHGKNGFLRVDVTITYALLLGGLALDVVALLMLLCSHRMIVYLEETLRMVRLAKAVRSLRGLWRHRQWSERTSQLNLISYCLGKPDPYDSNDNPGFLRRRLGTPKVIVALAKVTDILRVREIFDDFFFIQRERLSYGKVTGEEEEPLLLDFVFNSLKERAKDAKGEDMNTISGRCGGGVLDDLQQKIIDSLKLVKKEAHLAEKKWNLLKSSVADDLGKQIMDMLKKKLNEEEAPTKKELDRLVDSVTAGREFDESLLMWHIATDLCMCKLSTEDAAEATSREAEAAEPEIKMRTISKTPEDAEAATSRKAEEPEMKKGKISKTLSEYMLYLLIKQPEMLSVTAGIGLIRYQDTCAEAHRFFELDPPNNGNARQMLLAVNTSEEPAKVKGDQSKSVLFDGVILAKTLRELDEELMWEVVAGVWGEMLTYVAGKCRGSTHVKQLSCGSELITMVWFLMVHMGLGDMYKIHEGNVEAEVWPRPRALPRLQGLINAARDGLLKISKGEARTSAKT